MVIELRVKVRVRRVICLGLVTLLKTRVSVMVGVKVRLRVETRV